MPTPSSPSNEAQLWRMRWFLLIIILFWLLVAMTTTIVVVCLTKSIVSLSLFSTLAPPAYLLYWITKRLFPRDEKEIQLSAMKILQNNSQQLDRKLPI